MSKAERNKRNILTLISCEFLLLILFSRDFHLSHGPSLSYRLFSFFHHRISLYRKFTSQLNGSLILNHSSLTTIFRSENLFYKINNLKLPFRILFFTINQKCNIAMLLLTAFVIEDITFMSFQRVEWKIISRSWER